MAWISDNYGFDFETESAYQNVAINQLSSDLSQVAIYGIIIAKQDIRRIASRKQPGSERFVVNFTVRDSPKDTINAACWGDEISLTALSNSFTIGDVVRIKNPQIIERQADASDEKFRPPSNSRYQLNISSQYSEITICPEEEAKRYTNLLHCAMHPVSNVLNLADIVYNSQSAEGLTVNLLVAVKKIGNIQTVKTKDGKEIKKLQLTVFDQTHLDFTVLIWDEETAKFIQKFCSTRCIILISDIRVSYNNFMKEMAGTSSSSTIFTPEPDIPDARVLYQYAMKTNMPEDTNETDMVYNDPLAIYTVEDVNKLMNSSNLISTEIQGTVHAFIVSFDIDGPTSISSYKCPGCFIKIEKNDRCTNGSCEVGSGMTNLAAEEMYDIPLALAEHTGCLERCHLPTQVAQSLLGLKLEEFLKLSDEEKTSLKWNYLFERVTVKFKIHPSLSGGRHVFRIQSCEKM